MIARMQVQLSDVATFPLSLWVVFFITVSFYASVFVFIQNGSQFLEQVHLNYSGTIRNGPSKRFWYNYYPLQWIPTAISPGYHQERLPVSRTGYCLTPELLLLYYSPA